MMSSSELCDGPKVLAYVNGKLESKRMVEGKVVLLMSSCQLHVFIYTFKIHIHANSLLLANI